MLDAGGLGEFILPSGAMKSWGNVSKREERAPIRHRKGVEDTPERGGSA